MLMGRGLTKRYGRQTVLENACLEVQPGEGLALLGKNGSGKTTLLSLLALAARPDAGEITIDGLSPKTSRGALGYAPQEIALLEELTVEENLRCWSALSRADTGERLASLCAELDLDCVRRKRVDKLSGGQRQRVNLAAALMRNARYLLLDEPFSGVDADSKGRILSLLLESLSRGCGIIIASHHPDTLRPLVQRIMELDHGKTTYCGPADAYFTMKKLPGGDCL